MLNTSKKNYVKYMVFDFNESLQRRTQRSNIGRGFQRTVAIAGMVLCTVALLSSDLAFGQCSAPPPGDIPYSVLGQPCGPAQLDTLGNASALGVVTAGTPAISPGAPLARTLATRAADRLNVKDFGAYGDTQTNLAMTVSTTASSNILTVPSGTFVAGDVGKRINVDGAGPLRPSSAVVTPWVGYIQSIATVGGTQQVTLQSNPPGSGPPTASPATQTLSSAAESVTWGHDDTSAIQAAQVAEKAERTTTGSMPVIYVPAGNYMIVSQLPFDFEVPGAIIGDGINKTVFKLDAAESGPLFSWSDAWVGGGGYPNAGPTVGLSISYLQPTAKDFSVVGDLTVAQEQDALIFYDRDDRVQVEHVTGSYLWGRMAYAGVSKNVLPSAYMRESYWEDIWCAHCGTATAPVFELSTVNTVGSAGDSTNTNDFINLMAWDVGGPCLVIRNSASATLKATSYLTFTGGRCEGGAVPASSADLVTIGDPVMTGVVSNVTFLGTRFINSPSGFSALKLTAPAVASQPVGITGLGLTMTPESGGGINIQAGREIKLEVQALSTPAGTGVTIGSSAMVTQPVVIDGYGQERLWSWNVNSTSTNAVMEPIYRTGDPTGGNGAVIANMHDGSITGGSAPANGCTDLSLGRTAATQTCNAALGSILGGHLNQISAAGSGASILGGSSNVASGVFSVLGGNSAGDFGLTGLNAFASGLFSKTGDAEEASQLLRGSASGTTPVRMTADATAVSTHNTLNLPAGGGAFGFTRVIVTAFDPTGINACMFYVDNLLVKKGATAASTALIGTPAITVPSCDAALGLTASNLSITADTTNGGVNFTATGASGINLHVVAEGHFVAVQ